MDAPFRLGKKPATSDDRDIRFSTLLAQQAAPLPTPPARFGHGSAFTSWRMLDNDRLGDCVPAWMCHATMLWAKLGGRTATFGNPEADRVYTQVAGYDPNDPSTDAGTDMRQAMRVWRSDGIADASGKIHRIGAYIALDPKDVTQLVEASYIFGSVAIGFEFPRSAMAQFQAGQVWTPVPGSPIEGGHCVGIVGRTSRDNRNMAAITWGKRQGMSAAFYQAYNDEAWVAVSEDELRNGVNERGFDLTGLNAALAQLGGGV